MFEALFKMTRPVNIVIAIITLVVGYVLLNFPSSYFIPDDCNSDLDWINWRLVFIQALAFAFAIGFANIQNDILDLESDKMNRPERPLVTGKVSVKAARITWITLFVLMLLFGLESFPLVLFFPVLGLLLMAYNKWLKHIPLLKNMTVAFLCTTPLLLALFHFLAHTRNPNPENYIWAIIPAIPFAFLLTTAREIYKDLEDESRHHDVPAYRGRCDSPQACRRDNSLYLDFAAAAGVLHGQGFRAQLPDAVPHRHGRGAHSDIRSHPFQREPQELPPGAVAHETRYVRRPQCAHLQPVEFRQKHFPA